MTMGPDCGHRRLAGKDRSPDRDHRSVPVPLSRTGFRRLIRHETWIADNRRLARLRARFKTGIVTGRPRSEAEYALRRFDADSLFDVLVTLEETPGELRKPSPFGIQLAMSRLDATAGVYFGDSVDDMTAASAPALRRSAF